MTNIDSVECSSCGQKRIDHGLTDLSCPDKTDALFERGRWRRGQFTMPEELKSEDFYFEVHS